MATTVWRGHITFGLISVPVRLVRAARSERVPLKELYKVAPPAAAPSRTSHNVVKAPPGPTLVADRPTFVKDRSSRPQIQPETFVPIRRVAAPQDGDELTHSTITKGFEYEKDKFVTFGSDELKELIPKTATEMEIEEFVSLADIDPVYFETSYYIHPEEAGTKPYLLLYTALRNTQLVAIARVAMHRREHIVVVRCGKTGLIAHTLYYSSEVRSREEFKTDANTVTAKELELACKLVQNLAGKFNPEKYRDTYKDQLERLIASKLEGGEDTGTRKTPAALPAGNMIQALEKSLANLRKPPARAEEQPSPSTSRSSQKGASAPRKR